MQTRNNNPSFHGLTRNTHSSTRSKADDPFSREKTPTKNPLLDRSEQDPKSADSPINSHGEKYLRIDSELNQPIETSATAHVGMKKSGLLLVKAKSDILSKYADSQSLLREAVKDKYQIALEDYHQARINQESCAASYHAAKNSVIAAKNDLAAMAVESSRLIAAAAESFSRISAYRPTFEWAQQEYIEKNAYLIENISQFGYQQLLYHDSTFRPYYVKMETMWTEFSKSRDSARLGRVILTDEEASFAEKQERCTYKENLLHQANAKLGKAKLEWQEARIKWDAVFLPATMTGTAAGDETEPAPVFSFGAALDSESHLDATDIYPLADKARHADEDAWARRYEEIATDAPLATAIIGTFQPEEADQTAAAAFVP